MYASWCIINWLNVGSQSVHAEHSPFSYTYKNKIDCWTNPKTILKRKHGVCLASRRLHLTHESVCKNACSTPDYLWMRSYEPVMSKPSMKVGCSGLLGNRYQQLRSLASYNGSMLCPWEVFKLRLFSLRNTNDLLLLMQSAWDVDMCRHLK